MTPSQNPPAPANGYLGALRGTGRDARMFLAASGIHAVAIFGLYVVLLNLYLLRLGYGPEFIGVVQGTGILAIAALSVPASAAGRRWGPRRVIIGGLFAGSTALVALALSDMAPESIRAPWILAFNFSGTTAMTFYYVNHGPYQMSITTEANRTYHFSIRWQRRWRESFTSGAINNVHFALAS